MSRWRPSLVSLRPGVGWPGLVTRQQVFLAAKTAIAAGLAWVAALAADPHGRPYFAPLAVLLVVQPTVYDSLSRAFQRVAGVVVGVAAALAVSHFLAPGAWSIGIIIFAGLLIGWASRLGPQGAVQVPVSALLVFLVGRATPGYGGERITETLIGAGVAVVAVLLSPSAPGPDPIPAPRREHQGDRLSTRWNARARRERAALGRADEALLSGERIAIYTRSMARALVDGSGHARPMPTLSAMLANTASATDAYTAWVASAGTPADRRFLAKAVHAADDALGSALARVQQRWGSDPAQWLTFGITLAMSQRILAEVGRSLDPAERG